MFLPESTNLSVYQQSLKKAEKLDFDYLITGHSSELFPKTILKDYRAVADHLDFTNGKQQRPSGFAPGINAKRCWENGNNKKKRKERNKASIVISEDKL